jgi:hypothetical protein
MPPLLHFREPPIVCLDKTISLNGHWLCFHGIHYEAGVTCYVVGASSKITGEIKMIHFNDKIPGCVAPKALAATLWEEFKSRMTERSESHGEYEEDEQSATLQRWFERARNPKRAN